MQLRFFRAKEKVLLPRITARCLEVFQKIVPHFLQLYLVTFMAERISASFLVCLAEIKEVKISSADLDEGNVAIWCMI